MRQRAVGGFVLAAGVVGACVYACSSDPATSASDAGAAGDTTTGGDVNAAPGDAAAGDRAQVPTECSTDSLCFDVVPVRAGTTPLGGRIAVVWFQLDDDGPDPAPQIGYEAAFAGTEPRVAIPIAQIALPSEPNLLCQRACDDESICPCLSDPKVGIGLVIVMADGDAGLRGFVGVGQMGVAYSDKAYHPAPPASTPVDGGFAYPWDRIFPDGIEQGVRGYALSRPDGGVFDRFGYAAPGTVFQLTVCDSADAGVCKPKSPNFT